MFGKIKAWIDNRIDELTEKIEKVECRCASKHEETPQSSVIVTPYNDGELVLSTKDITSAGAKLRELREKQSLNQQDIAVKIDRSISAVSYMESGQTDLMPENLINYTRALGIKKIVINID